MKRYAVIDLGTNTFTMLIAEVTDNQNFVKIYHDRYYIKLAESGIDTISEFAFQRAIIALEKFKKAIDAFQVSKVVALGTAALRTASNGAKLVESIFNLTGIEVEIIDGDREAALIYEGVRAAYPFGKPYDLIMDIGGGSVEFIIANEAGKIWAQSFPVGVAVLKKNYHFKDPMHKEEIENLENFLHETLRPLREAVKNVPIQHIIGASGTFDVLERLFTFERISENATIILAEDALSFCENIIPLSSNARYNHENIPNQRADMIVVALLLIRYIIKTIDVNKIGISSYAMKEGLMSVLSREKN